MDHSQTHAHSQGQMLRKKLPAHSFYVLMLIMVLAFVFFIGDSDGYLLSSQTELPHADIQPPNIPLTTSNGPVFQTVQQTGDSVTQIYQTVQDSVVTITGQQLESESGETNGLVQGSGFVYSFDNHMVIITNFHVINQVIDISVTFPDGNGYAANVLGSDPYADLAVLAVDAPANQYKPLQIVSSSILSVGDFVIVVGSPFGLAGSMTTGIVSQLGRTITSPASGNYPIANVIQIDAPINPGNSGGPLLNNQGQVVGINTAIVSDSTGIGFAIPSNTILREISALVNTGSYNNHPYLGISSVDMNYYIAQEMDPGVTYGVLLQDVTQNGPADDAGLRAGNTQTTINGATITIGGDIIVAINGNSIINTDDLSSYLEENTLPGQQITMTIVRNGQTQDLPVTLGTRPPPDIATNPIPVSSPSPTIPETTLLITMLALIASTFIIITIAKQRKCLKTQ